MYVLRVSGMQRYKTCAGVACVCVLMVCGWRLELQQSCVGVHKVRTVKGLWAQLIQECRALGCTDACMDAVSSPCRVARRMALQGLGVCMYSRAGVEILRAQLRNSFTSEHWSSCWLVRSGFGGYGYLRYSGTAVHHDSCHGAMRGLALCVDRVCWCVFARYPGHCVCV